MDESPLIDKIPRDMTQNVVQDTTVSYFINNDKTWNRDKLEVYLPGHIIHKSLAIPIPRTKVSDKII